MGRHEIDSTPKNNTVFDGDGQISQLSLGKAIGSVIECVAYIDTENGKCIPHGEKPECGEDYDAAARRYIEKYAPKADVQRLAAETCLENVAEKLKTADNFSVYASVRTTDGREVYKKLTYSYLGDDRRIIALVRVDVSDIVDKYSKKLRRFQNESYKDVLTRAYNRKYYEEKLKMTVISSAAGVAMLDIDDFKLCNDVYGHEFGDSVLKKIANAVRGCLESGDTIVKYGGDEFLVLLPRITEENRLSEKLEEIRETVGGIIYDGTAEIKMTVSIGGTIAKGETVRSAAYRADRLMYAAKSKKNTVVTESGFDGNTPSLSGASKQQILIVDDSELNREILSEMLKNEFSIITADGGEDCIEKLRQYGTGISIVLLDIIMPGTDGFDVLDYMNDNGLIDDVPVVLISCEKTNDMIRRAYEMGASDYISRPFDVEVVSKRVLNIIKIHMKQRRLTALVSKQIYARERNSRVMIDILSRIVEFRNADSGFHVVHMKRVTKMILDELMKRTRKYNITWEEKSLIATASALHDIGKICIDEKILNKPGKLTDEEFEIMKTHTTLGAEILESVPEYATEKIVRIAAEVCRWHHERYDGKGYPDGLVGDEIPISAQVVSIADAYDALVSERVYKRAYSHDEAIRMICSGECGTFNPILLDCVRSIQKDIHAETEKE